MSNKYSPETLSIIKLWVVNTPPSPSILQKKESADIYKQEITKLTPDTFNIIKSWIEKTPPKNIFQKKRKSLEEFKL
tara:strand:+ start:511 stop:741 length:231 start_codon:yes stop_codon:yes gene_type:complete